MADPMLGWLSKVCSQSRRVLEGARGDSAGGSLGRLPIASLGLLAKLIR